MKHFAIRLYILLLLIFIHFSLSLSQTTFSEKLIIIEPDTRSPYGIFSCDLDNDGDIDVLSASIGDSKIAWYENTDGMGTFGVQKIISTHAWGAICVCAGDLDNDGDMDVLSASNSGDKISWYENTNSLGDFGSEQIISNSAEGAICVTVSDLDNDGDMDVLSASHDDDKIAWYENLDGLGTFGDEQIITASADGARSVTASDMDGDGDMDVLSASAYADMVAWYENTDGSGTFGKLRVITVTANRPSCVVASDFDNDGDMDVLSSSYGDNRIILWENTDGLGSFETLQIINDGSDYVNSVYASDVDGDGDLDVLSASKSDIFWYENTDGLGTFSDTQVVASNGASKVIAADLDNDGDVDAVSCSSAGNKIAWYENLDGLGSFDDPNVFSATANGACSVAASDLDNDGDMDVLSASKDENKIAWYENTDGMGAFGNQQIITTSAFQASCVYTSDLDGDGDMDVLSASYFDDKIAWYENTDGLGTFGEQQVITTLATGALSVYTADLDNDGDMDVLSANGTGYRISWYENTDGMGSFGEQRNITAKAEYPSSVFASDLDGDGDMDVLSSSKMDDKIAWYENYDGLGSFGAQQVITTSADRAQSVFASDLDGDGDNDVLSASSYDRKIAWYENTDGLGSFGSQKIITDLAQTPRCVFASDLDNDGDMDVLSASRWGGVWYENTDGMGTFGEMQFIGSGRDSYSITASDLDGDGDMDVLLATERDDAVYWFRNLFVETKVHEDESVIPQVDGLNQNYPNPFNNETVIQFDIREKGNVNLTIYNVLGKPVTTIAEGHYQPGSYQVRFDGGDLPSGIYFYRFQAGEFRAVKKMVLME